MKLQPKKQLNNQYQETRRIEIEEGVKLAKKIDVLRETLTSLETQHTKFLAGTRRELDEATRDKHLEIERLKGEVKHLEEQRKILMKPIDEEWEKLEEDKITFSKKEDELKIQTNEVKNQQKEVSKVLKDLSNREELLKNKEYDISEVSRETIELNKIAKDFKQKKEIEYKDFEKEKKTRLAEIEAKEQANANQIIFIEHKNKILDKREKDLNDKERKINHKYEQLLRTIKRIK